MTDRIKFALTFDRLRDDIKLLEIDMRRVQSAGGDMSSWRPHLLHLQDMIRQIADGAKSK